MARRDSTAHFFGHRRILILRTLAIHARFPRLDADEEAVLTAEEQKLEAELQALAEKPAANKPIGGGTAAKANEDEDEQKTQTLDATNDDDDDEDDDDDIMDDDSEDDDDDDDDDGDDFEDADESTEW